MRTMIDSVTARNIPITAEIVAGYVEGRYSWSAADWARFPNSLKVTIAIWNADADVLDIETGDATPAMGPAWVARQRARGAFPTVYCNRSTWPAVESALTAAAFSNGKHYDLWLADYTQIAHCPSWAAACQYADPGPVDLSLCQDWWPRQGVDDMTGDQDKLLRQIYNFLRYGADGEAGQSKLDASIAELWNFHAYGVAKTGGAADLAATRLAAIVDQINVIAAQAGPASDKLDAITAALAAVQTPTVDVQALAGAIVAKLPGSGLDPNALATAVANELAVRLKATA